MRNLCVGEIGGSGMKENEAIRILGDTTLCTPLGQAAFVGIEAIKEIQQYRAIGTVERFKQLAEQFKPHVTDKTSCPERHCNKCDKYRKENEKYHEIGTVEECREAREKQRGKKRVLDSYCGFNSYECPICGSEPVGDSNYCHKCGQRLE